MKLNIEIDGKIDSLMLWKLIERHRLNLVEAGKKTWVFGDANYSTIGDVIPKCALFGDLKVQISQGGGDNEQNEKKEES